MILDFKEARELISSLTKTPHYQIPEFIPTCQQQQDFYNSTKRIRLLCGGSQTGKSTAGGASVAHIMRTTPNSLSWAVAQVYSMCRICHEKIISYLAPPEIAYIVWSSAAKKIPYSTVLTNGAEIIYKSMDSALHTFEGAEVDGVIWIDEECQDREKFTSCVARTTMAQAPILMTMTPLQGETWVYHELFNNRTRQDIFRATMSLYDNICLDPKSRDEQIEMYSEHEIPYRVFGKWGKIEGRIYKEFSETINVVPFDQNIVDKLRIIIRGIDFGRNLACAWVGLDAYERSYIIADYKAFETPLEDFASRIFEIEASLNISDRIDDTITDHSFQERLELSRFGIVCTPANKQVNYGLEVVRRRIKHHLQDVFPIKTYFLVFDTCQDTIDELRNYQFKPVTGDKELSPDPLKKRDHLCDAIRYACVALEEYCTRHFGGDMLRIESIIPSSIF